MRITRSPVLPPFLLSCLSRTLLLLALLLPRLSPRLNCRRPMLLHRHPMRVAALRRARRCQHRAKPQSQQKSRELESKSHVLHRLILIRCLALILILILLILVLILIGAAGIFRLHGLRQVGQCRKIGKHVKVLESRQLLIDLRFVSRCQ